MLQLIAVKWTSGKSRQKKKQKRTKSWRQNPPILSGTLSEIYMENEAEIKTFSHKGES